MNIQPDNAAILALVIIMFVFFYEVTNKFAAWS